MRKKLFIALALLVVAVVFAVQQRKLNSLNERLNALQLQAPITTRSGPVANTVRPATDAVTEPVELQFAPDASVAQRLTAIEGALRELLQTSDYLMERGQVPLGSRKVGEVIARLNDSTANDSERLRALRLLRQGGQLNEQAVGSALAWLNGSTNSSLRENILRQMEGVTNSSLQGPLLQLARYDADAGVREQAVDNLRRYATNPQVEASLWDMLRTDPSEQVRNEAARALARLPVTETRQATLEQITLNPEASLDERLVALQALRRSEAQIPDTMAALAQEAFVSTDPVAKARLFDAFDGMDDPALKVPLVYGLQDPNPQVRERAADALSGYRDDPAVVEWLQYVAQNDADPQVRREALRAIGNRRL